MPADAAQPSTPRHVAMNWAKRLKRVFGIEIDTGQRCGGTLRIVGSIEQPEVIANILAHRERTAPLQPKQPEVPLGARAPPEQSTLQGIQRPPLRPGDTLGRRILDRLTAAARNNWYEAVVGVICGLVYESSQQRSIA